MGNWDEINGILRFLESLIRNSILTFTNSKRSQNELKYKNIRFRFFKFTDLNIRFILTNKLSLHDVEPPQVRYIILRNLFGVYIHNDQRSAHGHIKNPVFTMTRIFTRIVDDNIIVAEIQIYAKYEPAVLC